MPVTGLDHILIAIPESSEDEARRFYVGLLGLTEIEKPKSLAGRGGLWLMAGPKPIHIGTEAGFIPPKRAHPGFLVDDLAAMIEVLRQAGADLTFDVPLPGYDRVHVRDPFGNRLELLQKL
jgi:catechol 2,3-dioxygenase-like lactoylglutathione lyase family enzyme